MSLIDLLTPKSCIVSKKRFGPDNDGGYVLLDKSFGEVAVFGYGVGHDASFEEEVAVRLGCKAYVFDHTLGDKFPPFGPNTTFIPEGITAPQNTSELKTFSSHINHLIGPEGDVFLKIDVEGAEWDVIEYESFDRVTQLAIELHDLENDTERKTKLIQKITNNFDLVHIHGVNCHNQPTFRFNRSVLIPRYVECIFIRKGLVETVDCIDRYPTPYDMKSRVDADDVVQEFWKMAPEPINFKVDDVHIPFVKAVMAPGDTINGSEDGFTFTLYKTDSFPLYLVYNLDDVIKTGPCICYVPVLNRGVVGFELRITHPRAINIKRCDNFAIAIPKY
jgi:hypothetical protein